MKRMKVAMVVGTRPEIIRLSRVAAGMEGHFELKIVHTGQNFDHELLNIFYEQLELRPPDLLLDVAAATPAAAIARVIEQTDAALADIAPDAVLILGDTNSSLSALPARRRRIPVFHMEAGNRCFDDRVPEEINRRLVDHISDINLPYTEHARRNLLAEGLPTDRVIKTGSPMPEVLEHYRPGIDASDVLDRLNLQAGQYFVASAHREENVDEPDRLARLVDLLNAVAAEHDRPVILSTHPRTRKQLEAHGQAARLDGRVRPIAPLGLLDYCKLQTHAAAVLSDSGTLTEESALLDFPAVALRESHERPEGMDEGVLVMAGLDAVRVLQGIDAVTDRDRLRPPLPPDYQLTDVSVKVPRIILSYVDYVNRVVWGR